MIYNHFVPGNAVQKIVCVIFYGTVELVIVEILCESESGGMIGYWSDDSSMEVDSQNICASIVVEYKS